MFHETVSTGSDIPTPPVDVLPNETQTLALAPRSKAARGPPKTESKGKTLSKSKKPAKQKFVYAEKALQEPKISRGGKDISPSPPPRVHSLQQTDTPPSPKEKFVPLSKLSEEKVVDSAAQKAPVKSVQPTKSDPRPKSGNAPKAKSSSAPAPALETRKNTPALSRETRGRSPRRKASPHPKNPAPAGPPQQQSQPTVQLSDKSEPQFQIPSVKEILVRYISRSAPMDRTGLNANHRFLQAKLKQEKLVPEEVAKKFLLKVFDEDPINVTKDQLERIPEELDFNYMLESTFNRSMHAMGRFYRDLAEKSGLSILISQCFAKKLNRIIDYCGSNRVTKRLDRCMRYTERVVGVPAPLHIDWYRPIITARDVIQFSNQLSTHPSQDPMYSDALFIQDCYNQTPQELLEFVAARSVPLTVIVTQIFRRESYGGVFHEESPFFQKDGLFHQAPVLNEPEWMPCPSNQMWLTHSHFHLPVHSKTAVWEVTRQVGDFYIIVVNLVDLMEIPSMIRMCPLSPGDLITRRRIQPISWQDQIRAKLDFANWTIFNQDLLVAEGPFYALSAKMANKTRQTYQLSSLVADVAQFLQGPEYLLFFQFSKIDPAQVSRDTATYISWHTFDNDVRTYEKVTNAYSFSFHALKKLKSAFLGSHQETDSLYKKGALLGAAILSLLIAARPAWKLASPFFSFLLETWTRFVPCHVGARPSFWNPKLEYLADQDANITTFSRTMFPFVMAYSSFCAPSCEEKFKSYPGGIIAISLYESIYPLSMVLRHQLHNSANYVESDDGIFRPVVDLKNFAAQCMGAFIFKVMMHSYISAPLEMEDRVARHRAWNLGATGLSFACGLAGVTGGLEVSAAAFFGTVMSYFVEPPPLAGWLQALFAIGPSVCQIAELVRTYSHFFPCMITSWLTPYDPETQRQSVANWKESLNTITQAKFELTVPTRVAIEEASMPPLVQVPIHHLPDNLYEGKLPKAGTYLLIGPPCQFVRPQGIYSFHHALEKRNLAGVPALAECEAEDQYSGRIPCQFMPGKWYDRHARMPQEMCALAGPWLRAENIMLRYINSFSPTDLAAEYEDRTGSFIMSRKEWVAKFNSAAQRSRAEEANDTRQEGHIFPKSTIFLKADEVLCPRILGDSTSIKGRLVKAVHPTIQANSAIEIDKCMKRLKTIFTHTMRVGNWRIRYAIGSGMNGVELSSWFTASVHFCDTIHSASFIFAGDDTFFIYRDELGIHYCEIDFRMYDRTQGAHALSVEVNLLAALGMNPSVAALMMEAALSPAVYKEMSIDHRERIKMKIQRATGGPDTTLGNTLLNWTSVVFHITNCLPSAGSYTAGRDRHIAPTVVFNPRFDCLNQSQIMLGFEAKFIMKPDPCNVTFLKGAFFPTMDALAPWVWLPLPSQVIKLSKIMTCPTEIYKHLPPQEAWIMACYGMSMGVGKIPKNYPVLGPFLQMMKHWAIDRWPRPEELIGTYQYTEPHKIIANCLVELDEEYCGRFMLERYGLNEMEVYLMEEAILQALPPPSLLPSLSFVKLWKDYL